MVTLKSSIQLLQGSSTNGGPWGSSGAKPRERCLGPGVHMGEGSVGAPSSLSPERLGGGDDEKLPLIAFNTNKLYILLGAVLG